MRGQGSAGTASGAEQPADGAGPAEGRSGAGEIARPRVACVGLGRWGKNLLRNFHELGHLDVICDADEGVLDERSRQYPDARPRPSFEAVLADDEIEAVSVATPARTHGELARRALTAGKDVFVEKPLAMSLEEGRELVELADERDRVLMVGHLLWYHPAVRKLEELVERGELGRIRYVTSNRLNLGQIRRTENILWSFAPHDISVILGLVGEMPDDVQAHGGNYLHDEIADVTATFLSFPSGVKGHVFVSWLHPFKEQKLVVVGDRKMAVFNDMKDDDKLVVYPHTIDWKNREPVATKAAGEPVGYEPVEPLRAECRHFLECVRTRSTPRTDGREALRVLEVLTESQRALDGTSDGRPAEGPGSAASDAAAAPARPEDADGRREEDERPYFAHESACVEDDVTIGQDTKIWHFSHVRSGAVIGEGCSIGQSVEVGPGVRIGDGVKIQNNVSVYEGVTLDDHVFCGPSMVFTNVHNPRSEIERMDAVRSTRVRRGVTFGANCTVLCGIEVGEYAFVGAGAVVTKDVPAYALVLGNPARIEGWMCRCGHRIEFADGAREASCAECGRGFARRSERRIEPVRPDGEGSQ